MEYFCEVCPENIEIKIKYKHFKSKSHQEFNKCKQIILSHKNIDINDMDEAFYLYIIEHKKKFEYYRVKCEFKLVFNDDKFCSCIASKLSDNITLISWKKFLEKLIEDFKDKGCISNHVAEVRIISIANKLDMAHEFYNKHNMHAV